MKILKLVIIVLFLSGCAAKYTPIGQKKSGINPHFDSDCKKDNSIVKGTFGVGFVCAHDNGIIFVRSRDLWTKFNMTDNEMQTRAQRYCDLYHKDKKAINKGKANMSIMSKLDWTGIEFICN